MALYESFETSKRKFQKSYEKSKLNLSEISNENIKKINTGFRSENHYKPVTIVPITNRLSVTAGLIKTVELIDFPEWAINMSRPLVSIEFDTAMRPNEEVASFFVEYSNGTLEVGDISIITWDIFHWFTKLDNSYRFNTRFNLNVLTVTDVSDIGFSSASVPIFANVSLYILNERNYNDVQSG